MKNAHLIIICSFFFLLASCYEDKGNYTYVPVSGIEISGIDESYILVTGVDTLRLSPTLVTDYPEADLDYRWVIARGTNSGNTVSDKFTYDTIHHQRHLVFPVIESPGVYYLYCRVINRVNGYSAFAKAVLEVGTLYNRGHYILKETDGGDTELDLLLEDGQLLTDILQTTQGAPLPGAPRSLGMLYSKSLVEPDTMVKVKNHCLGVITYSGQAVVYRAFDMYRAFDHHSLFFEEPVDVPYRFYTSAYFCEYLSSAGLYAEHNAGILTAGSTIGKYSFPETDLAGGSDYWAFSVNLWGAVYWDETHHRIAYSNPNGMAYELTSNDFPVPGPDHDCLFIGKYGPDVIRALFRDNVTGEYSLYTVTIAYMRGTPAITGVQPLPSPGPWVEAPLKAANEVTANIIYFVHDNKLHYHDVANNVDHPIDLPALPVGATITHVANRHFNFTDAPAFDYFSIATYANGHYTLQEYNMIGGIPTGDPVFTATGSGRVKQVKYLAPNASYSNFFFRGRDYSR
ncbi:MAG: hypothetical protein LBF09_07160 [Odoribacteraceae bacterium]|jgi:hypothetical protein|nr:hypothetical protein [Odoribacteraceae bacterium]